jgi:hypothetical protein
MGVSPFRGMRRDIALALAERERTLYETAKALGRRSGDIQRPLRQMLDEGLLRSDSPEPTQGTLYHLSEEAFELLAAEINENVVAGLLAERQRLLVINTTDPRPFYELLGRKDLSGIIIWASDLGAGGEWLLALNPKADIVAAGRLHVALAKADIAYRELRVEAVLDATQLKQLSVATADVLETS